MPKYTVKSPVRMLDADKNAVLYGEGDTLEMAARDAAELLAVGVIEAQPVTAKTTKGS